MSFNRKRRFNDNDDYQHNNQHHHHHHHHSSHKQQNFHRPQQQFKRFRLPPIIELSKSVCADICTLGESPKRYVEDVEYMPKPIIQNFEQEQFFKDAILETLYAVTIEQPQKIIHIAGLIQSIYSEDSKIGSQIAEYFHQILQDLLKKNFIQQEKKIDSKDEENLIVQDFETGVWNKSKLILRLLSSLSFIVEHSSLIAIYKQFLKLSIDLQTKTNSNKRNPLGEAIYYNTLISIPYLLIFNNDEDNNELKLKIQTELIELAETFPIYSDKNEELTITIPYLENVDHPYESKKLVELILPAVKLQLSSNISYFPDLFNQLNGLLKKSIKHPLPQLAIPTIDDLSSSIGLDNGFGSVDGMWRSSRFTFQVYLPQETFDTSPPAESYFGLLLRDINIDIIESLEFNRKEVARQIITLDSFFKEGTFTVTGKSIDSLKQSILESSNESSNGKISTWKLEDVAFESVLSLIFKLPTASQPFIYFFTILVEACSFASQAIAPVMGRAIRFFYNHIHLLDFELRLRFLDWLSIQLSNFGFTWKWSEWEIDSKRHSFQNIYHPRLYIIKNLIAKNLRLSNKSKILKTLPEEFHQYLNIELSSRDETIEYYQDLFDNKLEFNHDGHDDDDKINNNNNNNNKDDKNDGYSFKGLSKLIFIKDGNPFKSETEKFIKIVHQDGSEEEIKDLINEVSNKSKEYSNSEKLLVTWILQTILFVGNRSISHATKYINNTSKFLIDLTNKSSQVEKFIIEATLKYWNHDPKTGYIILDILESLNIISSLSIIEESFKELTNGVNLALVNTFTIEAIWESLNKSVVKNIQSGKRGSLELITTIKLLIKSLNLTVEKIGNSTIILPEIDEVKDETTNLNWKYQTLLGVFRTVLRKYSEDLQIDEINELIKDINDDSTKKLITNWSNQLDKL
ncbi:hypothetical protein WICMUC_000019 [Wickerhamomyces mucosus]|uniref:MIF4G domain-containing protein n=1 Tax=Wickerhamomyces mucosus TaxID=1378264 RepID=A0A9P8PZ57_9ASCO|nr:hypothetical protein WICMUC_000019 [Wickerhamomyces mucosus]